MNVSLPDELRSYVDEQVEGGRYGSTSEYVRELIRRDQDRHRLRTLLLAAPNLSPARSPTTRTSTLRRHVDTARLSPVSKPVRLRQVAADDVDAALDYYLTEAGTERRATVHECG